MIGEGTYYVQANDIEMVKTLGFYHIEPCIDASGFYFGVFFEVRV